MHFVACILTRKTSEKPLFHRRIALRDLDHFCGCAGVHTLFGVPSWAAATVPGSVCPPPSTTVTSSSVPPVTDTASGVAGEMSVEPSASESWTAAGGVEPMVDLGKDIGFPAWVFGQRCFALLDDDRVLFSYSDAGLDRLLVVTGAAHAAAVARQLDAVPTDSILAEPSARDSMAAIGLAAALLERRDPDAVMGSFAADHVITDVEAFGDAVRTAVAVAREDWLVTLGIVLRRTATYGIVTFALGVLYLGLVAALGAALVAPLGTKAGQWPVILGTLGVAALFVPARNWAQRVVDRSFFRVRYDAAASLGRLGRALAGAPEPALKARAALEELVASLKLRGAAVDVRSSDGRRTSRSRAVVRCKTSSWRARWRNRAQSGHASP